MVTPHAPTARHIVVAALTALTLSSCTADTDQPQPDPESSGAAQPARPDSSPETSRSPDSSSGRTPQEPAAEVDGQELPIDVGALVERYPITVRDGSVQPARTDIEFGVGDTIELAVTSDTEGTLRAPSLDVSREVAAGQETVVPITVTRAGTSEVTFRGLLLAVLTVS